jgi:hypothetical protein
MCPKRKGRHAATCFGHSHTRAQTSGHGHRYRVHEHCCAARLSSARDHPSSIIGHAAPDGNGPAVTAVVRLVWAHSKEHELMARREE